MAESRHPRKGDVYEVVQDVSVDYLTAWRAPHTGAGTCVLRRGDRLIVPHDPADHGARGAFLVPVECRAVERRAVPLLTRLRPGYDGLYFRFDRRQLGELFRLVEGEAQAGEESDEQPVR